MWNKPDFLISFLDNTIILFKDQERLKDNVVFYGHSLAIKDFDISTDDYLMASVSSDKSIRLWDTDFGNCRRIINKAHDDDINKISIIRDTHYALTVGKDNYIKFWDLDTFQLAMRFEASMGANIRALTSSSIGDFFVIGGTNKTLRIFSQTKEQTFPIELKEEIDEENLIETEFYDKEKENSKEVLKKKYENIKTAEHFMDLIADIDSKYRDRYVEYENFILLGKKRDKPGFPELNDLNPAEYVLKRFNSIKRSKLDSILLFLHFDAVIKLFHYILYGLNNRKYVPLCDYLTQYLLPKHRKNIMQSETYFKLLKKIVN